MANKTWWNVGFELNNIFQVIYLPNALGGSALFCMLTGGSAQCECLGNQSRAGLSWWCVQVGQALSDSEASCFDCLSFLATPTKHGHGFCQHISLSVICFSNMFYLYCRAGMALIREHSEWAYPVQTFSWKVKIWIGSVFLIFRPKADLGTLCSLLGRLSLSSELARCILFSRCLLKFPQTEQKQQ